MNIIVQKYGGSSLADPEKIKLVSERITLLSSSNTGVVVVCSAMGDTTDDLLALSHEISSNPSKREMDVLLATGEMVSCSLVAMALSERGYPAVSLTGMQAGIQTETAHGSARISELNPHRIIEELENGRIAVVCGFQGFTEDHELTTLGRGGSDTTAVALAAALGATRCEIYTDVEGIYTADPRIVSDARKLIEIEYEEMLELAVSGAKMHPRSIELGALFDVPILVASSFSNEKGTLIHKEANMEIQNRVRGVAADKNVSKITVRGVPDKPGIAAALFSPLAEANVSVDTIVQNASADDLTDMSFTVSRSEHESAIALVESIISDLGFKSVSSENNLAKVSVVGTGMQNSPGYAALMFKALSEAKVNIHMITTSEIRITCIIDEEAVNRAVQSLHKAFELEKE
ncbi:MAG: aspartate kinase [Chloroflexi bacterium]|nr:aspartate kinase [Chloroflexota bacterium]|tara:strand:- start:4435 stop:5649 length:1215 start_codon:yes stop_codon:yes gene_type:complete